MTAFKFPFYHGTPSAKLMKMVTGGTGKKYNVAYYNFECTWKNYIL